MGERLPAKVICTACGEITPITQVRRFITLWARPGRGGSLSAIKDQHAHDSYRCDHCVREGRFPDVDPESQGSLLP